MTTNRHDEDRSEHEQRIYKLQQRAARAAGCDISKIVSAESDTLSPELREQFWCDVVDFEEAPTTTDFQRLTSAGIELPAPETLDDAQTTAKLWEVIDALADLSVFITNTDHLSDRQLYERLWGDVLHQEVTVSPSDSMSSYHVDLLGGWSEEDIHLYLKHYADEDDRQHWLVDFPDDEMPAHEDPLFDRDRHLPRWFE